MFWHKLRYVSNLYIILKAFRDMHKILEGQEFKVKKKKGSLLYHVSEQRGTSYFKLECHSTCKNLILLSPLKSRNNIRLTIWIQSRKIVCHQLKKFKSNRYNTRQERNGWADCIYLDLKKAFDKVLHRRLLWKLEHI